MLRETLKQEIDKLSESQLKKIAELVNSFKSQTEPPSQDNLFWQHATALERAQNFRTWVSQLPQTGPSLSDEAFDRSTIYD
ncbi:hypothetical protein H6F75_25520 [Nodosilinea sp. FACHB-131]|uniref:hypothetical protein n=1 Tax=Cyanophyceae TaxID=3028117 RepID=UPI001683D4AE|nr:hypothetical protein [Nodosilinea sp. FACHB-131]MBD1876850.1 hypothetical protein [Nodosilinea sp. FACHB-131]